MMRRLALAIFCGLLVGCSPSAEDPPPLDDSLMVEVLLDLHLVSARAEMDLETPPALRDTIFANHDIQEQEFRDAMQFYAERPERYIQIYEQVLNRLHEERRLPPTPEEERPDPDAQL